MKIRHPDIDSPSVAAIFSDPVSLRYLTGARFTAGVAVVGRRIRTLFVDGRYIFKARRMLGRKWSVVRSGGDFAGVFHRLRAGGIQTVCVDPDSLNASTYKKILGASNGIEVSDAEHLADLIRVVKTPKELAVIREAVRLTDELWTRLRWIVRIGMTERELSSAIKLEAMRLGAEEMSFEPIVASGPATAEPHAEPGEKKIAGDEPLMVDMGLKLGGYCSDFTRTPFLLRRRGSPPAWFVRFRDEVMGIQNLAYRLISGGCRDPVTISKKIGQRLKKKRLTNYYLHSLGHGVGMKIHEEPYLSPKGRTLRDGMVFTVEPGLYRRGIGGVRIEDMACLWRGRFDVLTKSSKELSWRM